MNNITTVCDEGEKTFDPIALRNFYKTEGKIKQFISYWEIAQRLNLSDTRCYQAYLFQPGSSSYRKPSGLVKRLSYYVAQELLQEGWQL